MKNITYAGLYNEGKTELLSAGIEDAEIAAKLLFLYVFNISLNDFYLKLNNKIDDDVLLQRYRELIKKRASHTPLQYITGVQNFCGMDFFVNPSVLIPRLDTEILVETVLNNEKRIMKMNMSREEAENTVYKKENYKSEKSGTKRLLDLCTGSGIIAVTLKKAGGFDEVYASDISRQALDTAVKNARYNMADITFIESDMFNNPDMPHMLDIIVSNPPYIKSADIQKLMPEVAEHEPVSALDGHEDGLYFYRIIAKKAGDYMAHGGRLYLEIGSRQAVQVKDLFDKHGFSDIKVVKDLAYNDRVVYMTRR